MTVLPSGHIMALGKSHGTYWLKKLDFEGCKITQNVTLPKMANGMAYVQVQGKPSIALSYT